MNRLVLIGNGFDLAHGLKIIYTDFINRYYFPPSPFKPHCAKSKYRIFALGLITRKTF